jgi:hypothetical protein
MKEGLQFFTDIHWPLIGLMIFFSTFALLVVLHSRFYKEDLVKKLSELPFEGENHE